MQQTGKPYYCKSFDNHSKKAVYIGIVVVKMLGLHNVMGLSLLPQIRLVSDRCRMAQTDIGLVKIAFFTEKE